MSVISIRSVMNSAHGPSIITQNAVMQGVIEQANELAASDAKILITGETGVGKELIAQLVHRKSHRSSRLCTAVNCGAIAADIAESEFFGHEHGAFTGATGRHAGLFESTAGGTLFLDEIGELSPGMQTKLLRVLEGHPFFRVGGTVPIKPNVRVITATNVNLEQAVQEGKFREDLFYRLNVGNIHVPPLRERQDDIPLLANHFLKKFVDRHGKRHISEIDPAAMEYLQTRHWAGNIRELENLMERTVLTTREPNITSSAFASLPPNRSLPFAFSSAAHSSSGIKPAQEEIDAALKVLAAAGLTPDEVTVGLCATALGAHDSQVAAARSLHISARVLAYTLKHAAEKIRPNSPVAQMIPERLPSADPK